MQVRLPLSLAKTLAFVSFILLFDLSVSWIDRGSPKAKNISEFAFPWLLDKAVLA